MRHVCTQCGKDFECVWHPKEDWVGTLVFALTAGPSIVGGFLIGGWLLGVVLGP